MLYYRLYYRLHLRLYRLPDRPGVPKVRGAPFRCPFDSFWGSLLRSIWEHLAPPTYTLLGALQSPSERVPFMNPDCGCSVDGHRGNGRRVCAPDPHFNLFPVVFSRPRRSSCSQLPPSLSPFVLAAPWELFVVTPLLPPLLSITALRCLRGSHAQAPLFVALRRHRVTLTNFS